MTDISEVVKTSNEIGWYKPDCEICGQGAFLCQDPRCPHVRASDAYEKRRRIRDKRTWIQRIAARILDEDDKY